MIRLPDESPAPPFRAFFCQDCQYIGSGRGEGSKDAIKRDHEGWCAVALARAAHAREQISVGAGLAVEGRQADQSSQFREVIGGETTGPD